MALKPYVYISGYCLPALGGLHYFAALPACLLVVEHHAPCLLLFITVLAYFSDRTK